MKRNQETIVRFSALIFPLPRDYTVSDYLQEQYEKFMKERQEAYM